MADEPPKSDRPRPQLPPPTRVSTPPLEVRPFAPPRRFTPPRYGESVQCQDRWYQLGALIGQGYYGAVYECTDEWGNDLVAKILLPRNRSYEEVRQRWLSELNHLLSLRHPNVTYVYDSFEYRDTFYLIIERCAANLSQWTSIRGEAWLPYVARDLLQGIDFIHSRGYVHKDIHAGNVMVRYLGEQRAGEAPRLLFKIGDLGLSNLQHAMSDTLAHWMRPPELLAPQEYGAIGPQVDIYHAGLLMMNMLLPQPVYSYSDEEVTGGKPMAMAEALSSRYADVIAGALRPRVADRIPSARLLWREILSASATA